MSLQRRLLLYLLVCAPLVWSIGMLVSVSRARHEVNELYDSEMIRVARQVQGVLASLPAGAKPSRGLLVAQGDMGESEVGDFAISAWDAAGELLAFDRDAVPLTRRPGASGFVDERIGNDRWRVYYLQSASGEWLVAAGQDAHERDEVVYSLALSQLLPWLVLMPILLLAMALAVQRALAPVRELSAELGARGAEDLRPLPAERAPQELKPLMSPRPPVGFSGVPSRMPRLRRFSGRSLAWSFGAIALGMVAATAWVYFEGPPRFLRRVGLDVAPQPVEAEPYALLVSSAQEQLADGEFTDAVATFEHAFESGEKKAARSLRSHVRVADEAGSSGPCQLRGLGHPRSFDATSRCVWLAGPPQTMQIASVLVMYSAIASSCGIGSKGLPR